MKLLMSENTQIMKTAGTVGIATLVGRILGFVRDVLIAGLFGAGLYSDAFFVAFRIPNLLRRLFAEGSLSMPLVSVFTEYMVKKGRSAAFAFAGSALQTLSVLLALVSLLGILASPWIIHVVAPGFSADPEKYQLTVLMNRIMFPYLFFIGLVAACMGILNVLGHFAAPALAPLLLNMAMIGSMLWISPRMDNPILGLCMGVVIGGALQLALQVPFMVKKGIRLSRTFGFFHPGLQKTGILMVPMLFGAAADQVNMLVGTFLASFLAEGAISYLYFADRLVQFPLGIFAVAATTATLPVLSRQAASEDTAAFRRTFAHSLQTVMFFAIPAMAGLLVLRNPIVTLLFQRGRFEADAVSATAQALLYYGMGIWAFAGVRVLISAYYALQDTRTPVKMALVSIVVNIALSVLLMFPMGFSGIALATAVSSMVHFCLLFTLIRRKMGGMDWKNTYRSIGKTLAGSMVMGLGVEMVWQWTGTGDAPPWLSTGPRVCICIPAGIVFYGLFSALAKHPEFYKILELTRQKIIDKKIWRNP